MQPDYSNTTSSAYSTEHHRFGQPSAVDLWEVASLLGFPAVLWRLPNQKEKHLIVSFDEILPHVSVDLDELPAGFIISPFDNITDGSSDSTEVDRPARTLFLRADIQAVFPQDNQAHVKSTSGETAERFWSFLSTDANNSSKKKSTHPSTLTALPDPDAQSRYVRNVAKAVEAMQRGAFRKVVLSRTKRVQFTDAPNAVELFDKLCQTYPTAFVSAVSIPEKGQIWMSATPERLVSIDTDGIFQTTSLAGTQSALNPDGTPKRPAEAMWSQKEIEEQALVSRYIIECFKKIRLREYIEEGPKSIIAGNLMHLGTSFTVDTQAVRYPQLGTVMLRLLHPTSAVCGTPRDVAFTFISQHETHDRELYSGFLGPVNMNTTEGSATDIFVHIRCMKLEGKLATLYAGAGLTEDSVPEREWQETEMKCQTLLQVMMNDE
ncbi:chorismate-binding protein [Spirosoma validum]|uniref:Chorismate-binding protein n=1 Tax=Spirosoma validum TaxID=2771355 RepID=A0A927GC37_9BACT|nr:chorismate-binding protein [Spirosoma validum]MBD2752259.1 chorismate-binding protein [Spirosoma validum]